MRTLSTSVLVLVICCCSPLFLVVPTNAEEAPHRRDPIGFQGVRGRRSATDVPPTSISHISMSQSPAPDQEEDEQPNTPPVTTNEVSGYIRGLPVLSLVKRAPVGFMGMRGKKDSEVVTVDEAPMDIEEPRDKKLFLNLPFRYIPKRAPSGFMGMRGKKFSFDSYKRAPSGFLGMRGKKESDHVWPPLEDLQVEEELMHSEPVDEEEQLNQIYTKLDQERELLARLSEMYGLHLWDDEKRAPANGFFGMRGKKFSFDDSVDKRAPMGFQGMRGKKWSDLAEEETVGFDEEMEKRAPQMGFHGMRGKKDVTDVLLSESSEKRAPAAGFFGMRGKKQPGFRVTADRRNLFGIMKSKKGPYEFRADGGFLQPAQLVESEEAPIKRVPSGFMGMRGKKWSDSPANEQ
ncbi:tachykinins isoform X2 [Phlebotomus argentipes]|uniref:tachykinins isoform X2 n=1 Tax=Phlebotomus argentipes TaxID=94469 RepID=UPI002892D7D6|nr:tachykinins isoform X2 [Phlebotomus argentipes]